MDIDIDNDHGLRPAPPDPDDLDISSGSCYYAPDTPAEPGFIPCGNAAAAGTQTCCWHGDMCLADGACFGVHDGGCTDDKDCPQAASPATMQGAGPCACPAVTQQRIVAFRDASVLASYASLPTGTGATIAWLGGYVPTAETIPTATASAAGAPEEKGTPRVPLIVGLAVGLAGAVLLVLMGTLFFFKRRRGSVGKMEDVPVDGAPKETAAGPPTTAVGPPTTAAGPPTSAASELEIRPARPWSMRSELDGGGGRTSYGLLSPMTTGPSLAEAQAVSAQATGSSGVSHGPARTGRTDHGRPPIETLVELE